MSSIHKKRRQILALSWDESELYYLRARLSGKKIEVLECDVASTSDTQLEDVLGKKRTRGATVLCAIPRSQVEILDLELPPATDAELPTFVRNEVSREIPDLTDRCLIDYLPGENNSGSRKVTAYTLRADRLKSVIERNEKVGAPASQIVLRALATASLFRRMVGNAQGKCLLVTPLARSTDVSVFDQGQVIFTRSFRTEHDSETAIVSAPLVSEIRRTLLVSDHDQPVEHIYFFGDLPADESIADLAEELELPVSVLDPFEGTESNSREPSSQGEDGNPNEATHRFAPLIGMIRDFAEGQPDIDFLNPRKPPKRAPAWKRFAVYSAVAALAVAAIVYSFGADLRSAKTDLKESTAEIAKQEKILKKLKTKASVAQAIDNWESNEIVVLDELRDLSDRFPERSKAIARGFTSSMKGSEMTITMPVNSRGASTLLAVGRHASRSSSHHSEQTSFDDRWTKALRHEFSNDYSSATAAGF